MSKAFEDPHGRAGLRQRAMDKLSVGRPAAARRSSQTEALSVLYQLASAPTTAGDAMALLHELQVHQVELDLQQEELRRAQAELEAALRRQSALVERAPVAYMTIDAGTVLCEINLAGARLLGAAREGLLGQPLAGWLAADSADALQALLVRVRDAAQPESCELQLASAAAANPTVHATIDVDTTAGRFLVVLAVPARTPPGSSTD